MELLFNHAGDFGQGVLVTLGLVVYGFLGSIILGTILAALKTSPIRVARAVSSCYILVFRNIPLPVQMVLFVFGLPQLDIQFSLYSSAAIALVLYTAPFVAETIRSGLNTVDRGELEASMALGFAPMTSMRLLVLPQALATVVRPLGNVYITMVKNTSVAALVGVAELTFLTDKLAVDEASPFLIFAGSAICYLVLGLAVGRLGAALDRKVAFSR
ncbi:amino acid ABC transporter permease [Arthrobacter wenxiniae]|uniref:Amino acid ABC transporter permease n=1 Tax=Arthrobacter wenxiniae TaxID=2713570 RepID=A0A7Y7IK43_9MICC|nr:amino acid ABC transporter permease [Arthrobacter wenxiniae]NVM96905.1 amino acid ABC transporter permease [Arthrobacter wenxiniae]